MTRTTTTAPAAAAAGASGHVHEAAMRSVESLLHHHAPFWCGALEDLTEPVNIGKSCSGGTLGKPGEGMSFNTDDGRFTVKRDAEILCRWTYAQATAHVLAWRAQDPAAAHARDLAYGERVLSQWTSGLASAERNLKRSKLPEHGPYGRAWSKQDQEMYTSYIQRTNAQIQALREAGPRTPEADGRLF